MTLQPTSQTEQAGRASDLPGVARLEFWFEFASTYSYLSAMRIEGLATEAGVSVSWRPFLLGPIFKAQGMEDSPFNLFPVKGRYMWRDMERICADRGLPFKQPDVFPQNGLLAARVAMVALAFPEGPAFCRSVYDAQFGKGELISDSDVLAGLLEKCGLSVDLIHSAQSDGIKAALRQNTEEAQARGVFGAPSFLVGKEVFWGDDRLQAALVHAAQTVGQGASA